MEIDKTVLEDLRKEYPQGCRVELVRMDDPYRKLNSGEQGIVAGVDDIGTVHVEWDCGSSLGVAYGADECRRISQPKKLSGDC